MRLAFMGLIGSGSVLLGMAPSTVFRTAAELARTSGVIGIVLLALAAMTLYLDELNSWYF